MNRSINSVLNRSLIDTVTSWHVSKYTVFYGPYFPVFGLNLEIYKISVFSPNTRKYGPEKTSYLDTFHTVDKAWFTRQYKVGTAQKITFSIKDFFSKCDQICRFLQIWSHLLNKSLMENIIFCAVWKTEIAVYGMIHCMVIIRLTKSVISNNCFKNYFILWKETALFTIKPQFSQSK